MATGVKGMRCGEELDEERDETIATRNDRCAVCAGNGIVYRRDLDGSYYEDCRRCAGTGDAASL